MTARTGFGKDVSLAVNGARVVIGGNDSKNKGVVVLLQAVGNLKTCDYEIIDLFQGEHEEDYSGGSVSISDDGQSIAIGAMLNDDGGDQAGHVRMHTYEGGVHLCLCQVMGKQLLLEHLVVSVVRMKKVLVMSKS